jgi:hypothetical protein
MRMPVTEVRVGMVLVEVNDHRREVLEIGSWRPASGGDPWVQFRLRCVESGAMFLAGHVPTSEVEVELQIV